MKEIEFMGSSREDLREFPEDARREVGFALRIAQRGDKALYAMPMVGFGGAGVVEIRVNSGGDTYRAVYAIEEKAIYVLHAFKKKSKRGRKTPLPDVRLIKERLRTALKHYRVKYGKQERAQEEAG